MDINIHDLWAFEVAGIEIVITTTILNTWIIMAILIVLAIVMRSRLKKFKEIPTGFQNAIEAPIEIFDNFVLNTGGEKLMPLGSWFFAVFAFILFSNLSGVIGLRPPTADFATTFALAIATFIFIHAMGIRHRKGAYLKSFFSPNFVFFPLNVIGELAKPISLSFRLFGNVLAGMILMTMVYNLTPIFVRFGLPSVLHAYFDVFSGALQTYIFCILSLMFIRGATE